MILTEQERILLRGRLNLSKRQAQIVELLMGGIDDTNEIATRLNISPHTVKLYLAMVYDKTNARSRLQLALLGLRGIGRLPDA